MDFFHIWQIFGGTILPGDQNSWGPNFLGTKFLGDQISRGPNFKGTKFLRDQKGVGTKFLGPKFLGDQMGLGTNSVTAVLSGKPKNAKEGQNKNMLEYVQNNLINDNVCRYLYLVWLCVVLQLLVQSPKIWYTLWHALSR